MHYADAPGGPRVRRLGARRASWPRKGTTCPDHFLRTKMRAARACRSRPAEETAAQLAAKLGPLVERYATDYAAYYERCKRPDSPAMRDPMPVLLLIPGIGLLAFQKDKQTARVAAEYYVNTINVMRWAEGVDEYVPIPEQEAFDIEYWLLEEAKLQRLPKPKALEGRIALVTGGAGGIGQAVARRLLAEGAARRAERHRPGGARRGARPSWRKALRRATRCAACVCDVTRRGVGGGVAGLRRGRVRRRSTSSSRTPASPRRRRSKRPRWQTWQRNIDVLATGYFLVGARGVRADEAAGARRLDRLRRQQERAGRLARRRRLLRGQGRGAAPRALPGARKARRSASASTSSTPTR